MNDHAPEFPQRRLRQRVAESADPQSSGIAVPAATDPDAGRNAIHKYEIYSTTDQFILDARHTADGGTDLRLLLRQPLDREQEDRLTLTDWWSLAYLPQSSQMGTVTKGCQAG